MQGKRFASQRIVGSSLTTIKARRPAGHGLNLRSGMVDADDDGEIWIVVVVVDWAILACRVRRSPPG